MTIPSKHDVVVEHRGQRVRIYGSAWWLNAAAMSYDGQHVDVARIHAECTTMRSPSQEQLASDPTLNPYWTDPSNEGPFAQLMLGLTESELARYGITPGRLVFPEVVEAARPLTNDTRRPVSVRRQQQAMDWVQNDCIGQPSDY
jgi:hypothetical protein